MLVPAPWIEGLSGRAGQRAFTDQTREHTVTGIIWQTVKKDWPVYAIL